MLGFTLLIAISIAVGAIGTVFLVSAGDNYSEILERTTSSLSALGDMRELFLQQRLVVRSISSNMEGDNQQNLELLRGYEASMLEAMKKFETFEGSLEHSGYEALKEVYLNDYEAAKSAFLLAEQNSDTEAGIAAMANGSKASDKIAAHMQETIIQVGESADTEILRIENSARSAIVVELVIIALGTLAAVILGLYFSTAISSPVTDMTNYMKKVSSSGDMQLRREDIQLIERCSTLKDEIGECVTATGAFVKRMIEVGAAMENVASGNLTTDFPLLSERDTMGLALNKVVDTLNDMFGEISGATGLVATGSRQVSDGSQALAQGSSEQAAAIEQLSSSIARIAKKTEENAEMSSKASEQAAEIKKSAEKGSRQMDGMLEAVKEIQAASMSIGKVIKVIDDIAFQTNILALNAAVEAARAGQHGKGFAVVAEEVRNLAAKSAEAAKDTESLIADTMQKSELGARIAAETAESLVEIVQGISESGQIVGEIAISSEEQASAIGQINCGIDQVAQVIHQNNATAQESASAAEEMSEQAEMLNTLASRFKIKDSAIKKALSREDTASAGVKSRPVVIDMGKY